MLIKRFINNKLISIADAAWAISYVTDDDNIKIQAVIDSGCVPYLVSLLDVDEQAVIVPCLRSVGNIVTGTDVQVKYFFIFYEFLERLFPQD